MGETETVQSGGKMATIIYVLYLAGLMVGVTAVIGVVMAYLYRGGAPPWLGTHFHFQIRTFWIGLFFAFIGGITTWLLIGWLILAFEVIWVVLRCAKGLKLVGEGAPVPNPMTWWF